MHRLSLRYGRAGRGIRGPCRRRILNRLCSGVHAAMTDIQVLIGYGFSALLLGFGAGFITGGIVSLIKGLLSPEGD